jgi:hypothetical protein
MALYWLSFCDPAKPPGTQFLGAAIVDGPYTGDELAERRADIESVLRSAWRHRCNPGGDVQSMLLPEDAWNLVPEEFKNVLMSRERVAQFDKMMEAKLRKKSEPGETPAQASDRTGENKIRRRR